MSETKPFASLTPTLLARKGGAKPAMRPQLHPIHQLKETASFVFEDDLGWNDHGEDQDEQLHPAVLAAQEERELEIEASAEIVQLKSADISAMTVPEVALQQEEFVQRVGQNNERPAKPRGASMSRSRRVAFTLRLDAERHLKLRLASTVDGRSAQQIVTEALDRLIEEMPEIDALVSRLNKRG